jgi:AcrR family transcriptional regulator
MTLDATEPGLRERKRRATRRAIQFAVLELVTERGLDNVTVDEVSRVADISPRTFFNYFGSKEEAIVGEPPSLPDVLKVEEFVAAGPGADLLQGIGEMIADAAGSPSSDYDQKLFALRRDLMRQHPHLFALRMARMRTYEDELGAIIQRRLAADDPVLAADPPQLEQRARLITLVAFAAMRHAWAGWADSAGTISDLAGGVRASFAQLATVLVTADAE